jgi:alkylhydroperoxidase family enzyme
MARIPYVDGKDLPEQVRGQAHVSNITRALSNNPDVELRSGGNARYIRHQSSLDPRLRELAIIQVGYSTRCAYEYTHHLEIGFEFGVTEADVRAVADETAGRPTGLQPLAKAVLHAAREMTDGLAITDATFAELRTHLDNRQLVDLVFAIANYNGVVRMLESLKVDLEDKYLPLLEKFPLPA